MADLTLHSNTESFIGDIKRLVEQGRSAAFGAVNAVMIETYWRIGQRIVEQEQKGKERAEYGTQLIEMLSAELTKTYGKGFSKRNLQYFRSFYLTFNNLEIVQTRLHNLKWSHILHCESKTPLRQGGICKLPQQKCGACEPLTVTSAHNISSGISSSRRFWIALKTSRFLTN